MRAPVPSKSAIPWRINAMPSVARPQLRSRPDREHVGTMLRLAEIDFSPIARAHAPPKPRLACILSRDPGVGGKIRCPKPLSYGLFSSAAAVIRAIRSRATSARPSIHALQLAETKVHTPVLRRSA